MKTSYEKQISLVWLLVMTPKIKEQTPFCVFFTYCKCAGVQPHKETQNLSAELINLSYMRLFSIHSIYKILSKTLQFWDLRYRALDLMPGLGASNCEHV